MYMIYKSLHLQVIWIYSVNKANIIHAVFCLCWTQNTVLNLLICDTMIHGIIYLDLVSYSILKCIIFVVVVLSVHWSGCSKSSEVKQTLKPGETQHFLWTMIIVNQKYNSCFPFVPLVDKVLHLILVVFMDFEFTVEFSFCFFNFLCCFRR